MAIINGSVDQILRIASQELLNDNIVAIPTETVYGLAALITKENAVRKIYEIKNRPFGHPLIMHIAKVDDLYEYAINIPNYVDGLIKKFWPGPLTLILNKSTKTPDYITGQQGTVAIRMPANKLTLELIRQVNEPVVAPSANKFMSISPTRAEHVLSEFGDGICIINDGPCQFGIESTIINATNPDYFEILRPGAITREDLYLGFDIYHTKGKTNKDIKYSGNHQKHYSPKKPLLSFKNFLELDTILRSYDKVCVIKYSDMYQAVKASKVMNINSGSLDFGHDFYHMLRLADENKDIHTIAIEEPPTGNEWESIWDRLLRAKFRY